MLKSIRLVHRIGAVAGVPLVLMIGAAAIACVQLLRIDDANRAMNNDRERLALVADWIGHVRTNLDRAIASTKLDAAIGDDEAVRSKLAPMGGWLSEAMAQTANAAAAAQKRMQGDGAVEDAAIQALVQRIAADRDRFVAARAKIRDDLLLGEGAERVDGELVPLAAAMTASLDALQTELGRQSAATSLALEATVRQALWLLPLSAAVAVLIGLGLAWRITRAIVRSIEEAASFAQAVSGGRLDTRLDAQGHDELAQLKRALEAMRGSLAHLVGQVRQAAEQIRLASAEVASGNADLSHRTEQAAANLQQTAASMEQLTGTVQQSSQSASVANQLAGTASAVARRGGDVVSQVVTTMQDIHASSSKIADIIGVIDGIAFQTNILALNAAVEAARAGEQGRGFAVVAGEVRSLAQRSAEAAKEIKALIGASVERVEVGSRLVGDAGATMTELVASVQRVSDIIGEISAATAEQNGGIGQVNGAVGDLDRMTQQNAALVEQSAAAAESLKDQAQRLTGVVGAFRLEGADA